MENRIYMAGKIEKNCWRHSLMGENPFGNDSLRINDYWENKKYLKFSNNFLYTGPYFLGCDHGCSHGESSHGASESGCADAVYGADVPTKQIIFKECIKQISDADYVFCWIDSLDCYGTLFELGIAYEKGKKIFIGIDKKLEAKEVPICSCGNDFSDRPNQVGKGCCHSGATTNPDDLWFIKNSGKNDYYYNPKEAWNTFLNWIK